MIIDTATTVVHVSPASAAGPAEYVVELSDLGPDFRTARLTRGIDVVHAGQTIRFRLHDRSVEREWTSGSEMGDILSYSLVADDGSALILFND